MDAEGVDKNSEAYMSLQREIIDTEQQLKSLETETKNFGSVGAQQVAAVGEKLKTVGTKMSKIGSTLTRYVTLPLLGAGTAAALSFAEVDKTMQLVNATMGTTTEEAEALNKAMEDAAANSIFTMADAATALLNFARAGLDAKEAAAALAPAMNLAAGEGGNLDTVSAGLVATINGFQDSFDDTARYADVFANACNNSALDVDSLSEAMSIAAPIFNTAGYSVEDAALYMGVMANNGIDANKAATSLKTGMARLVKPAKDGAEQMAALGLSITNADGTMKDTITIQSELHDAFANLSESEQIAAASAIFGKNQMAPWLALINTAPEEVKELSSALLVEGTTTAMASAMMSGFGGSIEKMKSSLNVLMTSLGRLLAEFLQPIIDKLQGWIDKFNGLDDETKKIIIKIGLVIAALGPLLLVGGKLLTGIGMLMTFAPAITAAFTGVIAPMLGIVAAIAAVIAIGVLLYKHWDEIKAFAIETWEKIKTAATDAWDAITTKFNEAKEAVTTAVENMKTTVSTTMRNMRSTISATATKIWTTVTNTFEKVKEAIISPFTAAKETVSGIIQSIKDMFDFNIEFPHINMPHFSWTWNDLGLIKIPNITVEWYKKAYDQPYMFNSPTIFGGRGFGDGNGAEMVYGKDALMRDIENAMTSAMNGMPLRITVQSVLDGRIIGQAVTNYQRGQARAMGANYA